ncbi:GNAT family N-acetyltransferase [Vibrio viridaestus]|uniref:GNAT family N-acetyltransferase n=1 Tax=Vibrio viridaestus TaxID=2487322 RepID=A0A3N9TMB0_9VIBR|nr:GNAT family N-acetyltransferase [Vibrio viridaestus]RQW64983.1 GNAT family N-acetyltransferase [Vibrio viridaestus]
MNHIEYIPLDQIEADDLLIILNKLSTRKHLVDHDPFDLSSVQQWMDDKCVVDEMEGCVVRAIKCNDSIVGWCGIQAFELGYEIAIVIDDRYWGLGKAVFKSMMSWAKELGHEKVYLFLLHTRPEYEFLRKLSERVFYSEMLGDKFTTYELNVAKFS